MLNKNYNNKVSCGLFDVLQIIFIILKLCELINWSWLWVLSPIWIYIIIVFFLIIYNLVKSK